jgi:two-component system response regulator AtoC
MAEAAAAWEEAAVPREEEAPPEAEKTPDSGEPLSMEAIERKEILDALARCGGNRTKTAEVLGISRKTLFNKLREYGI